MDKYPRLVTVKEITEDAFNTTTNIDGKWLPARPLGFMSWQQRWKMAWLVFTGKCDALKWPGDQ